MNRRLVSSVALLVILSACGSSSGHRADADGLSNAAQGQVESLLRGGDTYRTLSTQCRKKVSRAQWAVQMTMGRAFIEGLMDVSVAELRIGTVKTRNVTASTGDAAVEILDKQGNPLNTGDDVFQAYIYEDGDWRSTDCETLGDSSGEPASTDITPESTVGGELVPADEAKERAARKQSTDGILGQAASLNGLTISVSSITFASDTQDDGTDSDFTVNVVVRVENRTGEDQSAPNLVVVCASGTEGNWYSSSTYDPFESLPSGSFSEGTMVLGVPKDCGNPVVRAKEMVSLDSTAVDWPLPASANRGA